MILGDILSGNARRIPDAIAWRYKDSHWAWGEANSRVNRLASSLLALGLKFEDRAVIVSNNSNRLVELLFALGKTGIVAVPMAPRAVWREIAYVLNDVEASVLFVEGNLARALDGAPADIERKYKVIGIGPGHTLATDFDHLIQQGRDEEPPCRISDDAMRTIRFTSGTTGEPKGCIGTHRTLMYDVLNYLSFLPPIPPDERCLLPVSVATGYGLNTIAGYAVKGVETVLAERFDPGLILDLIQKHGVTRMCGVPTMITLITEEQKARPRDIASLRMFGYTGAPAAVATIREAMQVLGCDFYQGYGSTETGGRITYLSPEDHRRFAEQSGDNVIDALGRNVISAGRELPFREIRLVDADMKPVPEGEVGEVMVFSDSIFAAYWNKPKETAEVKKDGWLFTGDLARRDVNGFYYIVDRKRDMIVSGGYNVYSVEVETVLLTHPDVVEAAVFSVPDPTWGEAVWAAITSRPGRQPDPAELTEHCRKNLSVFKVPKKFLFIDSMPRTSSGKIRKMDLREKYKHQAA